MKLTTSFLLILFLFPLITDGQSEKNFEELADPSNAPLFDWQEVPHELQASFVSIDKRYGKHLPPQIASKEKQVLQGWKGERVSAQVILWTKNAQDQIEVTLSPFQNEEYQISNANAQVHFVRYVMTDEFSSGCGYRKPEDFAASLSADMLDNLNSFDLEKKTARPVWISVDIPREAKAGEYTSTIEITSTNAKTRKLTLELEVINRVLPPPSEWAYHLDLWQHPAAVAQVNNLEMWSDAHFEALKPIMKRLANAGQKVITATLNKDPWNVQTYSPYEDMIIWTKHKNGSWSYDYSVFDRWVSLMMDLGINKMINAYSIIPWNEEIHFKDATTGDFVDIKATPGEPEFEEYWTPFLKDFVEHLRQKGWLSITNIAMDERNPKQMEATFGLMKRVAPELGVSYADNHKTYKKYPESRDISIAAGHPFSKEDLVSRRERGLNTTFYVSCAHSFPNEFTFSDPAEPTYAAWYAMANGFDGMLRWAYNSWVKNPLQDSRFRTWPAGDTYMVYPQNRSSIRFERLREGIQDYEKLRIVQEELENNGEDKKLKQLHDAVQKLKYDKRTPNWNTNLNAAKQFLNSL